MLALIAIIEPVPARAAGVGSSLAERNAGDAFARKGDHLLYREVHWRYSQDGVAKRLVIYQCPDGAAFARKLLTESASPTASDYEFVDGRDGFAFVDVKVAEIAADRGEDEQVRRLRMSVDRWYGFAAPSIEVDYSTTDGRLLEFTGLGTVRDSEGRRQDVRIVFSADQRARDIPIKEVDAAAASPLVRQCTGRT